MKATFANLTTAVLFAGLTVASGQAVAEAYEFRLQAQNALASIAAEQRQALQEEAICTMRDQAVAFAALPAPDGSDYASAATDAERTVALEGASAAPAPVRTEAPVTARRANKFALPYFSFGKLTQGRKDN